MPADKDLKRLVRQRMARTGETYSTARMQLLARRTHGDAATEPSGGIGEDPRMRFHGYTEDGRRYIALTELPPEYSFVAEHTFEKAGDDWHLEYNGRPDDFDEIVANWQRDGATYIERAAGGPLGDWEAALEAVIGRLEGRGVWWFLLGTAALAVRGIPVPPNGVDVGTDRKGAETIAKLFVDRTLKPVVDAGDWPIAKIYGVLYWHSIVQVTAESPPSVDDFGPRPWGPEGVSRLETVTWRGHDILVTPLDLQLEDEKQRERKRNVTEILRWMRSQA
jgi:hypothetical protein